MGNSRININNMSFIYSQRGFKLSIITDKYQFIIIALMIVLSIINLSLTLGNMEVNSFKLIKEKSPILLSKNYIPNYTAGFTFFMAVAATNLFHQGNWQRVFAAKIILF